MVAPHCKLQEVVTNEKLLRIWAQTKTYSHQKNFFQIFKWRSWNQFKDEPISREKDASREMKCDARLNTNRAQTIREGSFWTYVTEN